MLREIVEKYSKDHIIYTKDSQTLWVTYAQGSGMTTYLPDFSKFITDGDTNFDSIVRLIKRWAKNTKPIKKAGKSDLFEIPVYNYRYRTYGKEYDFDIFGGEVKPVGKIYMIVTEEKSTIVNFFEKKSEALAWMRSIA